MGATSGQKESGKPVKSRLSALLKVIARGGLEPLSQNKNPVKKGGSAHRHASVFNLDSKPMSYIVKNLIVFRFFQLTCIK